MFAGIAPRYDLLNRLLSLGLDQSWRRQAVRLLGPRPGERILDLCSGTGDLALAVDGAAAGARVVSADFTFEMLALGRRKARGAGREVRETTADGLRLPFAGGTFDGVTAGFGVRNFEDRAAGFSEAARVLRPGGRFLVLEFTPEPTGLLRPLVRFHTRVLLPVVGSLVSGDARAYRYLPDSMQAWPVPAALSAELSRAGFGHVDVHPLSFGVAAIHVAVK